MVRRPGPARVRDYYSHSRRCHDGARRGARGGAAAANSAARAAAPPAGGGDSCAAAWANAAGRDDVERTDEGVGGRRPGCSLLPAPAASYAAPGWARSGAGPMWNVRQAAGAAALGRAAEYPHRRQD
jgi:hypothetical protein